MKAKKTDYQIIRESKNYTMTEFANSFGFDRRLLQYYENGEVKPSKGTQAFYRVVRQYVPPKKRNGINNK